MNKIQLSLTTKQARNIMRKDAGLSSDLDRTPQLTWLLFLKCFDDLEDKNKALNPSYRPAIESPYRWKDWASNDEGMTGDELLNFVNNKLLPYLRGLQGTKAYDPRDVIASLFAETYNRMLSGHLLRELINKIDTINFQSKDDIFTLSHLYESILKEMRDAAGTNGEFYTPRPVVRFMVEAISPFIGERVLDPACGTGGFLVEAYEFMQKHAKKSEDWETLQRETFFGIEKKPMSYLLGTMNLILHGIENPNIRRGNTLIKPLLEITEKDRFDVILTNPPFGGEEEKGIQNNFPESMRTSETALLFVQFIMRSLKANGRCAIVVPNGFMFGDGVAAKIKQVLLEDFNLHAVIRLPSGVFEPYTPIETNLLFFKKDGSTDSVWYYQVPTPDGKKKYSKTNPIPFETLSACLPLMHEQKVTDRSWLVSAQDIAARGFNLDIKNPNDAEDYAEKDPKELLEKIIVKEKETMNLLEEINKELLKI